MPVLILHCSRAPATPGSAQRLCPEGSTRSPDGLSHRGDNMSSARRRGRIALCRERGSPVMGWHGPCFPEYHQQSVGWALTGASAPHVVCVHPIFPGCLEASETPQARMQRSHVCAVWFPSLALPVSSRPRAGLPPPKPRHAGASMGRILSSKHLPAPGVTSSVTRCRIR